MLSTHSRTHPKICAAFKRKGCTLTIKEAKRVLKKYGLKQNAIGALQTPHAAYLKSIHLVTLTEKGLMIAQKPTTRPHRKKSSSRY